MHLWVLYGGVPLSQTLKILYVPSWGLNPGLLGARQTLYHVAIKTGLYRKAVQAYDILKLSP